MVRQRDAAAQREEVARSPRSIEPGELRTVREIVQGELIAPRDGGDLTGLSERVESRQSYGRTRGSHSSDVHGNLRNVSDDPSGARD